MKPTQKYKTEYQNTLTFSSSKKVNPKKANDEPKVETLFQTPEMLQEEFFVMLEILKEEYQNITT